MIIFLICLGWWLIGFIPMIILFKLKFGEIRVNDMVLAIFLGCGGLISCLISFIFLIGMLIPSDIWNKKIF